MNAPRSSQPNAKFRFWLLVVLIMLLAETVLSIGLAVLTIFLHRRFGIVLKVSSYIGGLAVLPYIPAFISAAAIGRRLGFVEPRRTETLRRIPGPLSADAIEMFEIRTPESARKQLMMGCLLAGCLIAVFAFLTDNNYTRYCVIAVSGVFFAVGLLIFWRGKLEDLSFVARIDKDGVVAYQGFRRHTAAWQEIEAVKIVTLSGAPGAPVTRTYTLLGQNAKRLFVFNLLFVPPAEQDKFERTLREAFGAPFDASERTT